MNDFIGQALTETLTGPCNLAIQLFNPTRNSGFAYDSHYKPNERDCWIPLRWSAEDCEIISKEHIDRMEHRYGGRNSSMFRMSVLGLPPTTDTDGLISYAKIEDAIDRDIDTRQSESVVGIDVARQGNDATVVIIRKGNKITAIHEYHIADMVELAHKVMTIIDKNDPPKIYVDTIGVGAGFYDILKRLYPNTFSCCFSNKAKNPDKFINLRAEIYWKLREMFEKDIISITNNSNLIEQLSTIKYKITNNGKIQIEAKEDIKKRLGGSPDFADSLAISFTHIGVASIEMKEPIERYRRKTTNSTNNWMAY
jgi:hypothetical protein